MMTGDCRAMAVSPGFRPDHVLTWQISVPWNRYPDWPARLAFNERLLQDLFRQPELARAIGDGNLFEERSGVGKMLAQRVGERVGAPEKNAAVPEVVARLEKLPGFRLEERRV